MKAYIDVRGPVPLYIKGMTVIELKGLNRNITVEQAEELMDMWFKQYGEEYK